MFQDDGTQVLSSLISTDDGWLDLYVTATMKKDSTLRANMLFLNKGTKVGGIPTFEETAAQYGIADTGYSTMAAFFDY